MFDYSLARLFKDFFLCKFGREIVGGRDRQSEAREAEGATDGRHWRAHATHATHATQAKQAGKVGKQRVARCVTGGRV